MAGGYKIMFGTTTAGVEVPVLVDATGRVVVITRNKGWFLNEAALVAAHPTSVAGDFAIVGATNTIWVWDVGGAAWLDTALSGIVLSVAGRTGNVVLDDQIVIPPINGNGFAIVPGEKGNARVPFAYTITDWFIIESLGISTTTSVALWKDTYANYPPTVGDIILTATLSGAIKNTGAVSVSCAEGDIIRANVVANNNAKLIQIWLQVTLP